MNDVDADRLIESLTLMKESLTTSMEESILKEIQDSQSFQVQAASVLISANQNLISKYEDLRQLIQKYIGVGNDIKSYQNLDKEVARLERAIDRELSEDEPSYSYIRSLRNKVRSCEKQMRELKLKIESSI